ncbi:MAG TPA: hypothetical protein VKW78_10085 [Terriglobales bacterium]|nr:hypothetical protein [Terriglobales bacterium]
MRVCRIIVAASILIFCSWSALAQKYGRNVLQKLPQASAAVGVTGAAAPKQNCVNWLWAAEVETILKKQKIDLPQTYWVTQANLGEVCVDEPIDLASIASLVERDYQLEDGSKFHLKAIRTTGAPSDIGHFIASLQQERPFILVWKGRPLLVTGMTYDQYGYPNGQRMYQVRTIDMVDPAYPEGDEHRSVTFVNGTDDPNEISGTLEVVAVPVDPFR